jgi:glycosyltransferase involved in cell wall biosynthesis
VIAQELRSRGFEVHVAAPREHAWAPHTFSTSQIERAGFAFHPISLSKRGENPAAEFLTFLSILVLLWKVRPSIVHLLTIKPILYGGLAARLMRIPLRVNGFTGLGQVFVQQGVWGSARRFVVSTILRLSVGGINSVAIVQNEEDHQTIAGIAPAIRDRIVLVRGSGVDLRVFGYVPLPCDGPPIVLFASRLLWEKGVSIFVDAAGRLKRKGLSARFVVVGATVQSNPRAVPIWQLKAWVDEGLIEWWHYRDDMATVLASCNVFCLPTMYREGVPKVLLEAAAIGRPIVTSDISGCRDVVEDGANGFLCPVGDAEAVAVRLEALLADQEMAGRMGREGRRKAESHFGVERIVEQTLDTYRRIMPQVWDE